MPATKLKRCCIKSATLYGVEAKLVDVEISILNGLPGLNIVGMPDTSIKESHERIKAAIKGLGFSLPPSKIVANLAPSSMHKSGSGFDLPIAIGILAATGQIPIDNLQNFLIVGELALDGKIRDIPGMLAFTLAAKSAGLDLLAPASDQLVYVEGVRQFCVQTLHDFKMQNFISSKFSMHTSLEENYPDFRDVNGHEMAKRALQIAAAGDHGVLMVGPPGSGKSMLASRVPSILPPLSDAEKMETAVIHSIAGQDVDRILAGQRPFRHPHHSATAPGLIGGGNPVRPGEVSLAHNGVLYLDELAEFSSHVLQGIRQPMEENAVTILRADGVVSFPAKFNLIAASNPCPCGYYGDKDYECKCTPAQIQKYQSKIGGPILDRIDMHLDVGRIEPKSVLNTGRGIDSKTLREGVLCARQFALWRKARQRFSEGMGHMERLVMSCKLEAKTSQFLEDTAIRNKMSGRGITRVLSVARTIADFDENEIVSYENLCEALTFRFRENEVGR